MKVGMKLAVIVASLVPLQWMLVAQNVAENEMVVKNSEPADFHQVPIMPQCFAGAMQRMNRSTGAAVFLVRVVGNAGCTVPSHWHTSGEQITVVSGTVKIVMQDGKSSELKEGGYAYIPSKHVHAFSCAGPCVHFVQSDGPYDIHYVNKEGKEIPLPEALKASAQ
jgi:quercetin dioxygenase-like cupin family protein